MAENQRKHHRVEVKWPCRAFKKGIGIAKGEITNASLGGAFLATSLQVSQADFILLEIEINNGAQSRKILCEGKVVRASQTDSNAYGYGLLFSRIKDEDLSYLLQLLANSSG